MLETAVAQLRFALSLALGRRFHTPSLDHLIDAIRDTHHEFGPTAVVGEGAEILGGPALDEVTRRDMQLRRFRGQAARAARETSYYQRLFADLNQDPARLRADDIARLPITPKEALRSDPTAFVRRGANPVLRMMTTGTTGWPTSVYFSPYEMQVIVALSAIAFLIHRDIDEEDIVQISTSSRATLGNIGLAGACARIGAVTYLAGMVDPAHTLALLTERHRLPGKKERASAVSLYPSYLGEVVDAGLRLGYRPTDFGLERILVGGEPVTIGLKDRCQRLFGPVRFVEGYAMTETIPFGGTPCSAGHLHFEVSHGLLEVIDPETVKPAAVGEPGTIVATPFAPYRETTILLRYHTEDVVRPLATPLTCSLRNLPVATSEVLGKLRLSVRHEAGWTFPRDVVEALEAVEEVALPARCGFWAVNGGVAVEVVTQSGNGPMARRVIADQLEARHVQLRELYLREHPGELQHPLPLRSDLRETSFRGGPAERLSDRILLGTQT